MQTRSGFEYLRLTVHSAKKRVSLARKRRRRFGRLRKKARRLLKEVPPWDLGAATANLSPLTRFAIKLEKSRSKAGWIETWATHSLARRMVPAAKQGSPHIKPKAAAALAPSLNYTPFNFSTLEVKVPFPWKRRSVPLNESYARRVRGSQASEILEKVEKGLLPAWLVQWSAFEDSPEEWVMVYRTPSEQPDADFSSEKICRPPCYCRLHTPDWWWSLESCINCYNYASEFKASALYPGRPSGLDTLGWHTHVSSCQGERARRYRRRERRLFAEHGCVWNREKLFIADHALYARMLDGKD